MDLQRIKILLDKYYQGNTSLEEEKILKAYFIRNEGLEKEVADQQLLSYFKVEKLSLVPDFSEDLEIIVKRGSKKNKEQVIVQLVTWSASMAAAILLLVGIFVLNNKEKTKEYADTYKNPDQAYLETKRVLLLISKTMNKKTEGMKYLSEVDKSLKSCSKLSEIDKTLNSVKNENN